MSAPYQYLVLHKSCKNRPGVVACQAAHAASECIRTVPVSPETHVCALEAETSEDLEVLHEMLLVAGIHHVLIREPDGPYNGAAVALGVEPMDREKVKPYMTTFRVLR